MKNKEKSINRKAMPKFLLVMLVSGLVGGVLGFGAAFFGDTNLPETIVDGIYHILNAITPWSIWVITAVLMALSLMKYRTAKRIFADWDGEEEESIEQADEALSWTLLFSCVNLILDFFFFGIGFQGSEGIGGWKAVLFLASFVVSMACIMVMQQKTVDLTRKMNPEKQGSIYDMKFKQKWIASCDENEQRQIGQAALKAFNAVTAVCVVLWAVLVLLNYVMDVGILPSFLVMLIWAVSQITYMVECIRLGRHK